MAQTIYNNAVSANNFNDFQTDALDSGHLMRDAFSNGLNDYIAVSDIMLAWMLRIPIEVDPADAARHILDCYVKTNTYIRTSKLTELVKMLQQLTQYDRNRMGQISPGRRKRKSRRDNNLASNRMLN